MTADPATVLEASDVQRGIWSTEQAGAAGSAYHLAVTVHLRGELDVDALRSACAAVVARHPMLRHAVGYEDGELCLVPVAAPVALEETAFADSWVDREVARPFDLGRGPLARFVLAGRSPREHTLLVAAHHLVFDGISKEVLIRDLAREYHAVRQAGGGVPAPRGESPDLAVWHAATRRLAAELAAARGYWQTRWREPDPPVLPGLSRVPRLAEPGTSHDVAVPDHLAGALARAARAIGVTRFEFLLATLQALLYRYGSPAPVVAVDMSTRPRHSLDLVGPFVNELPVWAPPAAGRTFRAFATAVRAEVRRLNDIRSVPPARVLTGMRPRAALAPVSLSYRRQLAPPPVFAGLDTTVDWMVFPGTVRSALHLQVLDTSTSVAVSLWYSPDALDPDAARRVGGHLRNLIGAAATEPDAPVARLALLDRQERALLLDRWNATARPAAVEQTVASRFETRVAATPTAAAVIHAGVRWTYADLDGLAESLAGRLRAAGAGPGTLVGVCVERSVSMLAALLAVGRIGAGFVPVDPAYPAGRRRLILADAGPVVTLASERLAAEVRDDCGGTVLAVPADPLPGAAAPGRPDPGRRTRSGTEEVAYVMYTSGSTGRPKGVVVPHRALANLLDAMEEELGTGTPATWLAHTSVSFDISTLELFLPLVTGGTVVLATASEAKSGAALVELVRRHGVSHVQATPSGWRLLLDAGFGMSTLDRKRVVALAGGEALPVALGRQLGSRVRRLLNVYGPTETTVWSTLAELRHPVDEVPIGRPIANTRAYVLDDDLEPVPVGLPGELYLGGSGLAHGYLRQPELTAAAFVPDPHGPAGARLYRTGDRVAWRPDGQLTFLGRTDTQVKIRGHRVELAEVESRIEEDPAVRQAVVALLPDEPDGYRLVGYLVPAEGASTPSPADLRALLRRSLPDAAIPVAWVTLDRLPLTPNGKLDRAALPQPRRRNDQPEPVAPGAPGSFLEDLREVWRAALRVDHLRDDEDVFDAGASSLTIIQIMNQMSARFHVDVPLDAFYDTPTLAGIAALALRRSAGEPC